MRMPDGVTQFRIELREGESVTLIQDGVPLVDDPEDTPVILRSGDSFVIEAMVTLDDGGDSA